MPANRIYNPADRPEVQVQVDGQWYDGDLYAWRDRDGEQWGQVRYSRDQQTYLDNFPAHRIRKLGLTDQHRAMIDFAGVQWTSAGRREQAILEQFAMSEVRYNLMLGWAIEQDEAMEYAPVVVGRLRRLQAARREARGSRVAE